MCTQSTAVTDRVGTGRPPHPVKWPRLRFSVKYVKQSWHKLGSHLLGASKNMQSLLCVLSPLSEKRKLSAKVEKARVRNHPTLQSSQSRDLLASRDHRIAMSAAAATTTNEERSNSLLDRERNSLETLSVSRAGSDVLPHIVTLQLDDGEELRWHEARRIRSEPVGLQSWPSACSLEAVAGERRQEDEEEDDVFAEESEESWEGDASFEDSSIDEDSWLNSGWEEFTIPAREIHLSSVLSQTDKETTFSGYWHGSVHVIAREAKEATDVHHFLQEVTSLNKIRHESIQLFMGMSLDMEGGQLGLVMSPLKGDTLFARLHIHGHEFSTTSKFKIAEQICEGMEYLHSRGIPHGSLSTSMVNIHHKVCIQFRPQVEQPRRVTGEELVSLAPEDIRALSLEQGSLVLRHNPSLEADIFAFGTLLYELVALEKPFKCVPRESVVWQVGTGQFQPLSLLPRDRLRGIIQRCWRLQPESRPTFKDILTDVEQNVPVFSTSVSGGLHRSLSLPSVLTEAPSPRLIS